MHCDCHIHMALDGSDWKAALARHKTAPDEALLQARREQIIDLDPVYLLFTSGSLVNSSPSRASRPLPRPFIFAICPALLSSGDVTPRQLFFFKNSAASAA